MSVTFNEFLFLSPKFPKFALNNKAVETSKTIFLLTVRINIERFVVDVKQAVYALARW